MPRIGFMLEIHLVAQLRQIFTMFHWKALYPNLPLSGFQKVLKIEQARHKPDSFIDSQPKAILWILNWGWAIEQYLFAHSFIACLPINIYEMPKFIIMRVTSNKYLETVW